MVMSIPHKRVLYSILALLWLSGSLWLLFHYFLAQPGPFGPAAHPLEKWWLRLHGLMAFAMLVLLGSLIPLHARAWGVRRQRRSGLAMTTVFGWLALTGYALYYFIGENNEAWLPVLHWGVGLCVPVALVLHLRHRYALRAAHQRSVSTAQRGQRA